MNVEATKRYEDDLIVVYWFAGLDSPDITGVAVIDKTDFDWQVHPAAASREGAARPVFKAKREFEATGIWPERVLFVSH